MSIIPQKRELHILVEVVPLIGDSYKSCVWIFLISLSLESGLLIKFATGGVFRVEGSEFEEFNYSGGTEKTSINIP